MLRSYQYTEKPYLEYTLQNELFRDKQTEAARKFVHTHPVYQKAGKICPVCAKAAGKYFYTKWNVDYLRCPACKSVYALYDDVVVEEYRKNPEIRDLRTSCTYQEEITKGRQDTWREFLEWIEVRAFRFMGRNREMSVIDYGNRYQGYVDSIRKSSICGCYDLRESILQEDTFSIGGGEADLVLYLDQMQQELRPEERIQELKNCLKPDGLLILNTRAGSGFDIITLKEKNERIYPYEHILLPSVKGLVVFLEAHGFDVLEITTPGVMDVKYVLECRENLDDQEGFVKNLLDDSGALILQEFQRFLQKSCMSSFVCVIARKKDANENI